MNIDVLEEQWLNSCWLSYSMFWLIGFMFLSCFLCLNYWVLRLLVILSDLGEIHGSLEGLEMKNEDERTKVSSNKPWGAVPTKAPQDSLCMLCCGALHHPEPLRTGSIHRALVLHASQSVKDAWRPRSFPIISY